MEIQVLLGQKQILQFVLKKKKETNSPSLVYYLDKIDL